MRRKFFFSWLLYSLCALLLALLQTLLLSRLRLWGVHPFVLPCAAAVTATYLDRRNGIAFAVFLGFVCDLIMPGVIPCFYILTFALSAFACGQFARRMVTGFVCAMAAAAAAMVIHGLGELFFLSFRGGALDGGFYLLLRESLVTLPAAVAAWFPVERAHKYLTTV